MGIRIKTDNFSLLILCSLNSNYSSSCQIININNVKSRIIDTSNTYYDAEVSIDRTTRQIIGGSIDGLRFTIRFTNNTNNVITITRILVDHIPSSGSPFGILEVNLTGSDLVSVLPDMTIVFTITVWFPLYIRGD